VREQFGHERERFGIAPERFGTVRERLGTVRERLGTAQERFGRMWGRFGARPCLAPVLEVLEDGVELVVGVGLHAGAYTHPHFGSPSAYFVGYVGYMISPQSIRQGDTGRCDQNGLGGAEEWTSVSPCLQVAVDADVAPVPDLLRQVRGVEDELRLEERVL
jgi:hypothetical protein